MAAKANLIPGPAPHPDLVMTVTICSSHDSYTQGASWHKIGDDASSFNDQI
jgi:hypothetical protein